MSDTNKADFVGNRGVIFNIIVYVIAWYIIDYTFNWFFNHYDIDNDLARAGILFLLLLVLLAIAYCRHYNIFFVAFVPAPVMH